jgi:hypothetical protein
MKMPKKAKPINMTKNMMKMGVTNFMGIGMIGATSDMINKLD